MPTIPSLFAYSDACRDLLESTLLQNPELFSRRFITTSRYDNVRMLLAHVIGAEERWIAKRIGGRAVEDYENRAAAEPDGLFRDARRVREQTYMFIDSLDAAGLARVVNVHLMPANTGEREPQELNLTVEDILFHIVNHETHHRAQISMAMQQFGADPPNFDYVLLVRQSRTA